MRWFLAGIPTRDDIAEVKVIGEMQGWVDGVLPDGGAFEPHVLVQYVDGGGYASVPVHVGHAYALKQVEDSEEVFVVRKLFSKTAWLVNLMTGERLSVPRDALGPDLDEACYFARRKRGTKWRTLADAHATAFGGSAT